MAAADDAPPRRRSTSSSYDALEERVENQGRMIRGLAEETATQFRDFRADTSKAISELVSSIKAVDTKLDANAKSMAETQRPQYAALFVGMLTAIGVAVTIIQWQTGLHDRPIDDKITGLQSGIAELTKATTTGFVEAAKASVSKEQYAQTLAFQKEIGDLKDTQLAVRRQSWEDRVSRIENGVVTRPEISGHWAADDKAMALMEDRMREMDRRFDSLVPSSADTTRRVLDRIHDLEQRFYQDQAAQKERK